MLYPSSTNESELNQEKYIVSIKQTGISYYGLNYVEHAEADFKEMVSHGCNTVILAITEFDMDFWFPSINPVGERIIYHENKKVTNRLYVTIDHHSVEL